MSFLLTLGHVVALTLLLYLWTYTILHRGRPGSRSLLVLFSMLIEWAAAVFAEYLAPPEAKIWFRNLSQIGVFGIPASLWAFTVSYTQRNDRPRQRWESFVVIALAVLGFIGVCLVMTDGWFHWVRQAVEFVPGPAGVQLIVTPTRLGETLVSVVFITGGASFLRLLVFTLRDGRSQFLPFILFLLAISIPTAYALFLQVNPGTEFRPPVTLLFGASALLLAFGAYRLDFLGVTPIARNLVFDVLEEGIVVCGVDGKVLDMNAAARALLLPPGGTFADAEQVLDRGLPGRRQPPVAGETREGEFPLEGPNGMRIVNLLSYPVTRRRGLVVGRVSVVRDVTQLRRQNAILVDKAERDGLTGLLNRATFVDRVERILAEGPDQPALLVFDIDEFKAINDEFGHLGGDHTLNHVVSRVSANLRETDVFGRLGGDEFAVFLAGLGPSRLAALAERIRAGVAESKLAFDGKHIKVAISIGFSRGKNSFEHLYHRADQALYEAKREGRNLVRGG